MQPHGRFTTLFWAISSALDSGATEDVALIQSKIADGSLFDYLKKQYPAADVSLLRDDDRAAVLRFFRALVDTVDNRRKFGVEQNGLLLLVAYSMEGVQQCVDSSHELNAY